MKLNSHNRFFNPALSHVAALLLSSITAQAVDVPFSIPGNSPTNRIGGVLQGLQDNATSYPTEILINYFPTGFSIGGTTWDSLANATPVALYADRSWDTFDIVGAGFTLTNGQLTDASFLISLGNDPFVTLAEHNFGLFAFNADQDLLGESAIVEVFVGAGPGTEFHQLFYLDAIADLEANGKYLNQFTGLYQGPDFTGLWDSQAGQRLTYFTEEFPTDVFNPVPEPSAMVLLGLGLPGLLLLRRRLGQRQ